jgi:peptidoglycan/LPS O-acetylase OafA/YrhL
MAKLLNFLSILCLLIVSTGVLMIPSNPMFWLASSSTPLLVLRGLLGSLLFIQLVTNPPRHVWFRVVVSITSVAALGWTIYVTNKYQISLLDTFAFCAASLSLLISALERKAPDQVSLWAANSPASV